MVLAGAEVIGEAWGDYPRGIREEAAERMLGKGKKSRKYEPLVMLYPIMVEISIYRPVWEEIEGRRWALVAFNVTHLHSEPGNVWDRKYEDTLSTGH